MNVIEEKIKSSLVTEESLKEVEGFVLSLIKECEARGEIFSDKLPPFIIHKNFVLIEGISEEDFESYKLIGRI